MLMPLATQTEEMSEVVSLAKDPKYAPIAALVSLGIMLFASSMNLISSTSISREGRTFWISKLIPVSPKDQVLAKLIHSSCLSLIALILIALPLYFLLDMLLYRLDYNNLYRVVGKYTYKYSGADYRSTTPQIRME